MVAVVVEGLDMHLEYMESSYCKFSVNKMNDQSYNLMILLDEYETYLMELKIHNIHML